MCRKVSVIGEQEVLEMFFLTLYKYEKGHQIISAFTDWAAQRESIKHSPLRLKRSIDFLGAEGVKITCLTQHSHCSATLDLSNKEQSQEKANDRAGKRDKGKGIIWPWKTFPGLSMEAK